MQSTSVEIRELFYSKAHNDFQQMRSRQNWLIQKISSVKKTIMDNSIDFQFIELNGNEQLVLFSKPETQVAQLICRYPWCNSKLASNSSRNGHEKSKHSQKKYSCKKCNFAAEREETIENHKLRVHGVVE
jgi:hypothetical protein